MTSEWDLFSAGFWLVFVVWALALKLVLAGLDEPDPDTEAI